MLSVAAQKMRRARAQVDLIRCDASSLPFADQSFDAATIAFAIDDMPDRGACVSEVLRVLRVGGQIALLELSQPDVGITRMAYHRYLGIFRMLSYVWMDGYGHLEREILAYRGSAAVRELLARAGFGSYQQRELSGGIARLHLARKFER
jgi:demethylmenaquinone methyltransferase/2-methoxy-6-polyprenyl-1,4-benzoquinol methylase